MYQDLFLSSLSCGLCVKNVVQYDAKAGKFFGCGSWLNVSICLFYFLGKITYVKVFLFSFFFFKENFKLVIMYSAENIVKSEFILNKENINFIL